MEENSKRFDSLDDVKKAVESNGNVLTLPMGELRDAAGTSRLGKLVLERISKELSGLGLGHYPQELPNYQHESVRIYKLGSSVGDIIDAVLKVGEKNDETLKQNSVDHADILKKVRELVCPDR